VTGLAYVLTGSWTVAEDLTQDAFFAAYRRWDQLCEYDKPGAWVRRAVANRAVSWRRRISSEVKALTRLNARRADRPGDAEGSQPDADVWAMVRRLSPRQAQVFALTYVEDLPLDRVAAILEISEDTAKTHLKRARAALTIRDPEPVDPEEQP
jgi:RNA polymerase sigma-70 factor (ECF subfamily)